MFPPGTLHFAQVPLHECDDLLHLAIWLSDSGYLVALIDADDQQTASKCRNDSSDHEVDVWVLEGTSAHAQYYGDIEDNTGEP